MNQTGLDSFTGESYSDSQALVMPSSTCDLVLESCARAHCEQGPPHVEFGHFSSSGQGRVLNAVDHCSESARPCPELIETKDSKSEVLGLERGLRSEAKSGSDFSKISHFNSRKH